jgi:hypothetical protein
MTVSSRYSSVPRQNRNSTNKCWMNEWTFSSSNSYFILKSVLYTQIYVFFNKTSSHPKFPFPYTSLITKFYIPCPLWYSISFQFSQEIDKSTHVYSQNQSSFKTRIISVLIKLVLFSQIKCVTLTICYNRIKGISMGKYRIIIHAIVFMFQVSIKGPILNQSHIVH